MSWLWLYTALTFGFVIGVAVMAVLGGNDE